MEELDFIVISLLQGKYQKVAKLSDEEFLEGNHKVFKENQGSLLNPPFKEN
jgi:hypothetical protein